MHKKKEHWKREQLELKKRLILKNDVDFIIPSPDQSGAHDVVVSDDVNNDDKPKKPTWADLFKGGENQVGETKNVTKKQPLKLVGGADVSFFNNSTNDALAQIVVCSYPTMKVVYECSRVVKLTEPYISGFLAFREVQFLVDIINHIKTTCPKYLPQVILVDGNGILHYREFGIACHLGVLTGIPTIGVAKTLLCIDGISHNQVHSLQKKYLDSKGSAVELISPISHRIYGAIMQTTDQISLDQNSTNPKSKSNQNQIIYISQGHRLTLESCIYIVRFCSIQYQIPEPIRQADERSRAYIQQMKGRNGEKTLPKSIDINGQKIPEMALIKTGGLQEMKQGDGWIEQKEEEEKEEESGRKEEEEEEEEEMVVIENSRRNRRKESAGGRNKRV